MPEDQAPGFLFLDANSPWVYGLASGLAVEHRVHVVGFADWLVYLRQRPTWPSLGGDDIDRHSMPVLPTGYSGALEPIVRPFMQYTLRRWRRQFSAEPFVVVVRPFLAPWVRHVPDDRLIYYNVDDYLLYRPERADRYRRLEDELIQRARLTLCSAQRQRNCFRDRHPDRAERIIHLPHGVYSSFINENPQETARPETVGYVGGLGDRVDWPLVDRTVDRCPDLTFEFVGERQDPPAGAEWGRVREQVFECDNVRHVGYIPYEELPDWYASFDVQWIPYDTDNPFNVASSPTKIMDGIASGRPIVSTPVPECTLYPEWIDIVSPGNEAVEALQAHVQTSRADGSVRQQARFARKQTWEERAEKLLDVLERNGDGSFESVCL
ncbi:glycosyltransferase involved in cell wall biosynthesis [Salinibacter ruber]|uniref:glycosyltransferase family protein n=1 Tax=Salinibacter ruber TaxID=146919 RepID=UPI002168652E|nr:glycosyltransferase [Salinibacter ruber]MCS3937080.1 glycosyltransferase involved in cell wall biosynthesis [Salinibacter ruber]